MSKPAPGTWFADPAHFTPKRRDFLHVGFLGSVGLTMGDFFRLQARAETKTGRRIEPKAEAVIQIFLPGGMAAQETWDPKPYAPIEYRGPLYSIDTKLKGVRFGQHLQKTAQIADKLTIIRSMTHGEADHDRGVHNMFTGYKPSPALKYPSFGSVVAHELGSRNNLPPYVTVPSVANAFAGTGYLSSAYGPFSLGSEPNSKDFKVRDLNLPGEVTADHFEMRKSLLARVDNHFRTLEKSDAIDAMDSFYQRAYSMISSQEAREAFNLAAEPDALRDDYGRHNPGQRMLLARRLVESGVRFVSLTVGGWDHHENINDAIGREVPPLDQAFSALIRDLEARGMLDKTLVMVTSEFGRTPKINKDAGRDHYPKVFSVALAGGGLKKGYVHGASDATSTLPDADPVSVQDFAKTVYHLIGIDADKELVAPGPRPIEIVDGGHVMNDLLA
jgi:hypothetical protein